MITLRADQEDLRTKLRVALRQHRSVLAYAPTGFGKTVLAAALIKMICDAGKRVIFCVHRVDLITQTAKTFAHFGIPFSYIASGYHCNPYHRIFIASIPTLKNRLIQCPANYVFVDEAHLSASAGWAKVVSHYKAAGSRVIGLSGTPERLDGKPLGDVWDTMAMGPSVRWLIDNGHLSRYRAFAPAGLDMTGVKIRGGDYVASDVDEIMAGKAVLAGAVKHWRKLAFGKRTIAFAPSVKRAEHLASEFRDNGIVAVALDGNTPAADRRRAFEGFADRQIDIIVNCALFCEGFDLAAQVDRDVTIEAVLQWSPTQSLAKHLQQLGRGLRKKTEPAILLDLVGNLARPGLGLPDDEREWSLEGRKGRSNDVKVLTCPECFASHPPAAECPECGHKHVKIVEPTGGREYEEVEGALEEVDVKALRRQRAAEQFKAQTLDELIELATARGYKSPKKWAAHVWTAREARGGGAHG